MDLAPAASTLGIFGKAAWCRMLRLYLAVLLARRHGRMALHKDGNGPGSDRVECLGTQNRNPNLKPEPAPNTVFG